MDTTRSWHVLLRVILSENPMRNQHLAAFWRFLFWW
jgi:hypothetical protein